MNVYQNVNVTGDAIVSGKVTAQTLEADTLGTNAQAAVKALISAVYPVGAYYWSGSPTEPGSIIGGTWEQIKGKFLFASDDVLTNGVITTAGTYHVGATGGSADAVVVEHTHTFATLVASELGGNYTSPATANDYSEIRQTAETYSTGVSGVGKNMPPYLVAYAWKRIA